MKSSLKLICNSCLFGSSLFILGSFGLMAAETDQFVARHAIIKEGSAELNVFYQEKMSMALDKVNAKKNYVNCRGVALEVLTQVLGEVNLKDYYKAKYFSKVSSFVQKSPSIDRFPEDAINDGDYRMNSIYKNRPFPFNVVNIGRTININDVFIGTDKIGHFAIVGRTYYKHFLDNLNKGMNLELAENNAVLEGIGEEIAFLGYKIGGTLSYGDLEANFQGLQFAREMCEGQNPYLILEKGLWIKNPQNIFDIKKYVTPKFDESYNVSFWSPRIWGKLKNEIIASYCQNKSDSIAMNRFAKYDKVVKTTNNDVLIERFLKERPEFDRSKQLLGISCQ